MTLSRINKILIANRGEIACRIIKTAQRLGIETAAVYSDPDRNALHVNMANEAYYVGPAPSQESYLRGDKIISIAKKCNAQAIHPGYGFLSENVEFASLCKVENVIFIGPSETAISSMGIKSTSKEIMEKAGVPVIKGYHGLDQDKELLMEEAKKIGFPVMLKAVRGGGGKGMRIALDENHFFEQLESAKRESLKSFNDDTMLIEKFIETPRHVEVQVFGDQHGNYVHLCERDCSVQRRHQKVIEEAPGPGITVQLREKLGTAAVRAAEAIKYVGAGTVEFIMDKGGEFYFMEMNTRLQVEHPVTEMITGTDLVEWQLRVAAGEPLPVSNEEMKKWPQGHAVEARIYAEDCSGGHRGEFLPTAGRILSLKPPKANDSVRIDTGVIESDTISVYYDPMISKLIVWSHDRASAMAKLVMALKSYHIVGLPTNIEFLSQLASHSEFLKGNVHTDFINQHQNDLFPQKQTSSKNIAIASVALMVKDLSQPIINESSEDIFSPFIHLSGYRQHYNHSQILKIREKNVVEDEKWKSVKVTWNNVESYNDFSFHVECEGDKFEISCKKGIEDNKLRLCINNDEMNDVWLYKDEEDGYLHLITSSGQQLVFRDESLYEKVVFGTGDEMGNVDGSGGKNSVAPMPGVIERVLVNKGDLVEADQNLVTLVAMKMEYSIRAGCNGVVDEVCVTEGQSVSKNQIVVMLKPDEEIEKS